MVEEELPNYGQTPVTRRCVEKDIQYLEFDSPFNVEFVKLMIMQKNWGLRTDSNE